MKLKAYVLWGLGKEFSDGIIYGLAGELMKIPEVVVQVGGYSDWEYFAQDARNLPDHAMIIALGHSLGGSVLPNWARRGKGRNYIDAI